MLDKKPSIQFYEKLENYDQFASEHEYAVPEKIFDCLIRHIEKHKLVLDIGIGTGLASIKLVDLGLKIFGVDGSKNQIEICKKKEFAQKLVLHDLSQGDIPSFSLTFDIIISSGVFEFVLDLNQMFKSVRNILNEDGLFCFCVRELNKNSHIETIKVNGMLVDKNAYKQYGILCVHYSEQEIETLLKNHKFDVLVKDSFTAYVSPTNKDLMFNLLYLCK